MGVGFWFKIKVSFPTTLTTKDRPLDESAMLKILSWTGLALLCTRVFLTLPL